MTNLERKRNDVIEEALDRAGVPKSFLGYQYLEEASEMILNNKCWLCRIESVFEVLAEENGTTSARIKRSIYLAIRASCDARGESTTPDIQHFLSLVLQKVSRITK